MMIFDQQDVWPQQQEAFNLQLICRCVSLAMCYAVEDVPLKTWLGCFSESIDSIY
jgi:hypothetical protein